MHKAIFILFFTLTLSACTPEKQKPITLAINPWPGYEFLYLAEQKGFFKQVDLDLKLIQLGSLSDGQRAYLRNNTDGMASTLIEAIQTQVMGNKPLKIVMVNDYSNGGDVILTNKSINKTVDLKGKTIGCEVSSLGIFILQRALDKAGLALNDITVVNVEQSEGMQALLSNRIDAFISYPPVSVDILSHPNYHSIFSSAEIPREVIDVVSFSDQTLKQNPELVTKLHQAWDMALEYYHQHPEESATIMSKREHISSENFIAMIENDIQILTSKEQKQLLKPSGLLQNTIHNVCKTLVQSNSINTDCGNFDNIIFSTNNI